MTALAQGAAGVTVALGFALLGTRRTRAMAMMCAAQALVVALAAITHGDFATAAAELIETSVLVLSGATLRLPLPLREGVWGRGLAGRRFGGFDPRDPSPQPPPSRGGAVQSPNQTLFPIQTHIPAPIQAQTKTVIQTQTKTQAQIIAAGAVLAALGATVPGAGLPLAVILLGLLLVAARPLPSHQALGIAAVQNGLVLAAVTQGLPDWRLAVVVVPILPALAFGALWLGGNRTRTAALQAPHLAGWIDAAVCGLALLLACALPWQLAAHGSFWRVDARAAHVILLLAALAAAGSWSRRDATQVWGSQLAVLAGTVLAVASSAPLLSWAGMALAAAGASAAALPARTEAWRRLRLGCTGLGLALFGAIALHASIAMHATPPPLPATACAMLGYGTLALLSPELAVAAVALILRGAQPDSLLLALGLAALLVAALGLRLRRSRHVGLALSAGTPHRLALPLAGLAQAGAAVFAFGLGTDAGNLAGLLQLSFLALTQCTLLLAREGGLDRLAALAGLAGLPPFGLFPSLALLLLATAARFPWLLVPLSAGLAAVAWTVLLQLPSERRLLPSPAWLPLALLLLAGFAMPDPLLAWFRLAAR